ncbi:MAG: hypothetical protein KC877_03345 [Candidatus Kaiserbacteria bacterium]|nr:hypothetical protein [Candidatus Kaiserbacteria bacterium]MCB9815868.1 hypothetical protein [Candidatus Nomurabacteria bacterium]
MFRTRDFILIFTSIVFLLVAITATTVLQKGSGQPELRIAPDAEQTYVAEVYEGPTISRAERLAALREKISAGQGVTLEAPVIESEDNEESVATPATTTETEVLAGAPVYCPQYAPYTGPWPRTGVSIEVAEGARLVYEAGGLDSADVTIAPGRSVLLQLPVAPFALAQPACLRTDVIGIAQDGSLIRNNEAGLYGVFGAETIVGYALDGFPIYGTSAVETDTCGGAVVGGQYGYRLTAGQTQILNCFSATPVTF